MQTMRVNTHRQFGKPGKKILTHFKGAYPAKKQNQNFIWEYIRKGDNMGCVSMIMLFSLVFVIFFFTFKCLLLWVNGYEEGTNLASTIASLLLTTVLTPLIYAFLPTRVRGGKCPWDYSPEKKIV